MGNKYLNVSDNVESSIMEIIKNISKKYKININISTFTVYKWDEHNFDNNYRLACDFCVYSEFHRIPDFYSWRVYYRDIKILYFYSVSFLLQSPKVSYIVYTTRYD